MARQPESSNEHNDTHKRSDGTGFGEVVEGVRIADGLLKLVFPDLHGAEIPDEDPRSALPSIAEQFADRHSLPAPRVLDCLRRLVDAEAHGRQLTGTQLYHSFTRGFPSLLSEALVRMPPLEALDFCETEDLNAYQRRKHVACVLHSDCTPLLSLDELGRVLSEFIHHQENNRDALLSTGHPTTRFSKNLWLDLHLNKLYFTKLPIRLRESSKMSASKEVRPTFPRLYVDWRRLATRTTLIGTDDLDQPVNTPYGQRQSSPFAGFHWARRQRGVLAECEYAEADTLSGLSDEAVGRLQRLRPIVFEVKTTVLTILATAVRERDHDSVLTKCLQETTRALSAEDADFLLEMDIFYAGYEARSSQSDRTMKLVPLLAGGLTAVLELIGYVKKELVVGTLAKTRDAISQVLTFDGNRMPIFVTSLEQPKRSTPTSVSRRNPYLDLIAKGNASVVQRGLDLCADLDSEEPAYWSSYRREIEQALSQEFYTSVSIRIKKRFQPQLQPTLEAFAERKTRELEADQGVPAAFAERCAFRRVGTDWNIRFDGGDLFALTDLVGLTYIHQLIENQGQTFSGRDMISGRQRYESLNTSRVQKSAEQAAVDGSIDSSHSNNAGFATDAKALKKVRDRFTEINAEIDDAKEDGDESLIQRLEAEHSDLRKYVRDNTDPHGQPKVLKGDESRARKSVRKAINDAIARISQKDSDLSEHLAKSILSNGFEYLPERELAWQTQ